jgi:hypothetical protein
MRRVALCLGAAVVLAIAGYAHSAVTLFTYDFPGTPANGTAAGQTASEPAEIDFGDFTRVTLTANNAGNRFNSSGWNITETINPTEDYISVSLTYVGNNGVNLERITFDQQASATAPNQLEWRSVSARMASHPSPAAALFQCPTVLQARTGIFQTCC